MVRQVKYVGIALLALFFSGAMAVTQAVAQDAGYYTNWGYSDVAFDSGYRDGLSAGRKDFSERKDYRPEKHDSYEDGDHGYRKSFGTKEQYKEQYRKGFLRGYEDAFNRRGH